MLEGLPPQYSPATGEKNGECLWVRDLEDWFSETGKKCVEQIRKVCPCPDCTERRRKK